MTSVALLAALLFVGTSSAYFMAPEYDRCWVGSNAPGHETNGHVCTSESFARYPQYETCTVGDVFGVPAYWVCYNGQGTIRILRAEVEAPCVPEYPVIGGYCVTLNDLVDFGMTMSQDQASEVPLEEIPSPFEEQKDTE